MPFVNIPVTSTAIARLEYDLGDQTLAITFQKGGNYLLKGVPEIEAERLANSPSPGSYWNLNMRGKY